MPAKQPRQGVRKFAHLAGSFVLALAIGSCGPGLLRSGGADSAHASFQDALEDFPELSAISHAFDKSVSPAPEAEERTRQLDRFAEIFSVAHEEFVEPVTAQSMVLLALEGFEAAQGNANLEKLAQNDNDPEQPAPAEPPDNPLAAENLMDSGVNTMLAGLDPHSAYLSPEHFRETQVRTRGHFGGIGVEVTMENGLVRVVAPIDGTPGAEAGLQSGDLITRINEIEVLGLTLQEAVRRIRGPAGTSINLQIRRPPAEDTFPVTIRRAIVRIESVHARVEGSVGYLRVTTFNERAKDSVRRAVRDLNRQIDGKPAGFVLDLRDNPGGLLDQAVGITDTFLSSGEIVSTRRRDNRSVHRFRAGMADDTNDAPIIVLINAGSASASEIVSGALQDHDRAVVLGTRSFGKGSVQTIMPLNGGGALRLTTARYYTPAERSIQANGITPDIIADHTEDKAMRES